MLDEVVVDLFHDNRVQLLQNFLQFIRVVRELNLILLNVLQDVLVDELPEFVAVLEVRVFAHHARHAIHVRVLGQLVHVLLDFGVNCLCFFVLLGGVGLSGLLHELLVLLFEDHSLVERGFEVFVGTDDHALDDVIGELGQAEQLGDGGVDLCVDVEDFLESAADVNGDRVDMFSQQFGNIEHIYPIGLLLIDHEDIKGIELVVGSVVNPLLH